MDESLKQQDASCFWCSTTLFGYGHTYEQAWFQARNNKLAHEATCSERMSE